ncbi:WD40 repeat domain-containing protein [Streptomyces sp. TRM70350]|uniref:WD40 repeat domain-containing protein n=1 Tax=Streptomyces sp. TRM70350 TaxID=2856165 RepID=UPI001C494D0F|nr:WD40 repeat domain-containing protein [Streptomyces sp. TRM70350]MBV7696709.1 WD40 repeat domain-containing protein [Streptomyces sp. TRM70350]
MRRSLALLAAALLAGALAVPTASAADGDEGFTIRDPRITESSGLAASRLHPGVYWTHNDSDDGAYLYAVDSATGETVATLTLTGVGRPRDVEAISIGPGDQIYVGDIGDNLGGTWDHVWIYQLPEPEELRDQTVRATQYVVQYSDGARDAESLVVHPKTGRVYIIDKKEQGGHLYEGPAELSASGTNVFKPVAPVADLEATDAAFSPDGEQLVIRSYFGSLAYDWNGGRIKRTGRLGVPSLGQGESVTYTADGTKVMFGNEGAQSSVEPLDAPGASSASSTSPSADGSPASEEKENGGFSAGTGAIAVVVACALLLGLRRLRRRG